MHVILISNPTTKPSSNIVSLHAHFLVIASPTKGTNASAWMIMSTFPKMLFFINTLIHLCNYHFHTHPPHHLHPHSQSQPYFLHFFCCWFSILHHLFPPLYKCFLLFPQLTLPITTFNNHISFTKIFHYLYNFLYHLLPPLIP